MRAVVLLSVFLLPISLWIAVESVQSRAHAASIISSTSRAQATASPPGDAPFNPDAPYGEDPSPSTGPPVVPPSDPPADDAPIDLVTPSTQWALTTLRVHVSIIENIGANASGKVFLLNSNKTSILAVANISVASGVATFFYSFTAQEYAVAVTCRGFFNAEARFLAGMHAWNSSATLEVMTTGVNNTIDDVRLISRPLLSPSNGLVSWRTDEGSCSGQTCSSPNYVANAYFYDAATLIRILGSVPTETFVITRSPDVLSERVYTEILLPPSVVLDSRELVLTNDSEVTAITGRSSVAAGSSGCITRAFDSVGTPTNGISSQGASYLKCPLSSGVCYAAVPTAAVQTCLCVKILLPRFASCCAHHRSSFVVSMAIPMSSRGVAARTRVARSAP